MKASLKTEIKVNENVTLKAGSPILLNMEDENELIAWDEITNIKFDVSKDEVQVNA